MEYKRIYFLKICTKFFIQMIIVMIIFLFASFIAYLKLQIFGLIIGVISSFVPFYFFMSKLYWILQDIYNMDIKELKGIVHRIEYSVFFNILPCEITLISNDKKNQKYHIFYYNKRIIKNIGDTILVTYLKKSKILIDIVDIKNIN